MSTGGTIIRLIDVALIILFGFIAITDIQSKSQIKMPAPGEPQAASAAPEVVYLLVKIDAAGNFRVERDDELLAAFTQLPELETFLRSQVIAASPQSPETVVVIDPEEDSVLQRTIDVFDLCERHGIVKAIHFKDEGI